MKNEEKIKNYKLLLEQSLEINTKILKECYWRPTVSQETLVQLENLISAIEESLKTSSV